MEITLLAVPDCPNVGAFEERLTAALVGRLGVVVRRRQVADEREAAEVGMRGSPILLIDGVDPFARTWPGAEPVVPDLPGCGRADGRSAAGGGAPACVGGGGS